MNCASCGTHYRVLGDGESGYVRSLCACEADKKCGRCKRGKHQPTNQARLDLEREVRAYACAAHGDPEAAEFPIASAVVRGATPAPPEAVPDAHALVPESMIRVACRVCRRTHVIACRSWTQTSRVYCPFCGNRAGEVHKKSARA